MSVFQMLEKADHVLKSFYIHCDQWVIEQLQNEVLYLQHVLLGVFL